MKQSELEYLLLEVELLARQAGAEIMRHYTGTAIYTKSDGSNVTDADYAAENIILPALEKLTPGIPIISEERVAAGQIPDISKGTFWTVDPLDGTHEFIAKTGAFVVAIALIVDSKPVMGVIYHPALDLMYSGAGPGTATKVSKDGERIPLAAKPSGGNMRVLVNAAHSNLENVKGYLSTQFNTAVKLDGKSSILRACQVADGLADMAVVCANKHKGRTAFWDVAPGHAVIEAAGGRVETMKGKPLRYKAKDLLVPPHIALSPHQVSVRKTQKLTKN